MPGQDTTAATLPPKPKSVVLTDWGADTEYLCPQPADMLEELILLSLLYDSVLVQDEVLALSQRLSIWFMPGRAFEFLEKVFDIGSVQVLTHPTSALLSDELMELSLKRPIEARAKYVQRFATKGDRPFQPTDVQEVFYGNVDHLITRTASRRHVGALRQLDIMAEFARILHDVLTLQKYRPWLTKAFPEITPLLASKVVAFIEDPARAVTAIEETGEKCNAVMQDGKVVFNRALGYQLSCMFEAGQKEALQRLIQTAFAPPFCWREEAVGTYSTSLREPLWVPPGAATDSPASECALIARSMVPLGLPTADDDFPAIIRDIRYSQAGLNLRQAIRTGNSCSAYLAQQEAWHEVAAMLAARVVRPKPMSITTSLVQVGTEVFTGSVVHAAEHLSRGLALEPIPLLGLAA